jgi:hypothetical protein
MVAHQSRAAHKEHFVRLKLGGVIHGDSALLLYDYGPEGFVHVSPSFHTFWMNDSWRARKEAGHPVFYRPERTHPSSEEIVGIDWGGA